MYQTLQLHSLELFYNLCSGLFYIPACIKFLSGLGKKMLLLYDLLHKQTTKTICRCIITQKYCKRIDGQIEGDRITNKSVRLSSPWASERQGDLRMDNPLGLTRAAKAADSQEMKAHLRVNKQHTMRSGTPRGS